MITKRKCQNAIAFNKDKSKPIKDSRDAKLTKENKKAKKQSTSKLKPSQSKKNIKSIMPKQSYSQSEHHQDQNQNRSNIPCLYIPATLRSKQGDDLHNQREHITMRKSASTGGIRLMKQIRKSLSPALSKEKDKQKYDLKQKYSSKATSRSQKQKIEKTKENSNEVDKGRAAGKKLQLVQKLTRKKSERTIKPQSQRIRTENSSKVPEVKQERKQQKIEKNSLKRKMQKMVKPKMIKNGGNKSKSKLMKSKDKKKKSIVFSDVSFHQYSPLYSAIAPKENFYLKIDKKQHLEDNKIIKACITIQRHFRGYLTRKYIQQSKYMIYCIIKIQKVWRGYWTRKKLRKQIQGKKNLSIQNSLITIKDFSEEPKQEKLRNKSFKFNFENQVYTKQRKFGEQSADKKHKNEDEQKYLNILQSLLQQDGLQEKIKQKIRNTLGKEKYVKNKIISEIVSEKSFNSPREVISSPKASIILNSPSSWVKNKPQIDICSSPRNNQINQSLSKRLCSPVHKSASNKKSNTGKKLQQKNEIVSLQTSFQFIQEFQLRIVDYLRDNIDEKQMFLDICKKCEKFRTLLILSEWNMQKKSNHFLNSLRVQIVPDIFSNYFRNEFLSQSEVKIYLEDNNYQESLWISNQTQAEIYSAYIKFVFDGLAEAIYQNYKSQIMTKRIKGTICNYSGHQLFKVIFTNSLTYMQTCSQYLCGAQIPVGQQDQNYKIYQQKNNQRIDILVKNDLSVNDSKECEGIILCTQLQMSQRIFEDLIREILQFLI